MIANFQNIWDCSYLSEEHVETTFALHQWMAGDFVDEILQKESINFVWTKVMFYHKMNSMFGIHYNLTRNYDMNTQRSENETFPLSVNFVWPKPKLCFIITMNSMFWYITISQGNTIRIRSDRQTSMNLVTHHKIVTKLFLPQTSEITSRPVRRSSMNSSSKIPAAQYKHLSNCWSFHHRRFWEREAAWWAPCQAGLERWSGQCASPGRIGGQQSQ